MKPSYTLFSVLLVFISCQRYSKKNIYQPNFIEGKDAVISEAYGNQNFSKINRLHLLSLTVNDTIDSDSRFLIRFNFSDIPPKSHIDSVFLYFSAIEPGHFGTDNNFNISLIENSWYKDKVNWNNQPRIVEEGTISINGLENKYANVKLNITPLIRKIFLENLPNHGLLFKLKNEEKPYKGIRFHSSEAVDSLVRPKLVIYWY